MTEDEAQQLLTRLGQMVSDRPVPMARLLTEATRSRRKRRRVLIGVAVAAATVVVGAGAVALGSTLATRATDPGVTQHEHTPTTISLPGACPTGLKYAPDYAEPLATKPPFPTNVNGQTYGSDAGVNNPLKSGPELAAVVGDCGKAGFVYETDLMGPQPTSPADAQRIERAQEAHPPVLAVYEVDGTTQIDTFTLRSGTSSSSTKPSSTSQPVTSDPAQQTTPPSTATRLVGAKGVVVTVPTSWRTEVQVGSFCPPTSPGVVEFFVQQPFAPVGSCAVPQNSSWPANNTVSVYTRPLGNTPGSAPDGTIDGMAYYLSDSNNHQGSGAFRALTIPDAGVQFLVGAATATAADAILTTVQLVPENQSTVAVTYPQGADHPVLDVDPAHPLSSTLVEVPAESSGEPPGQLLRTDPAVGTPVPDGSTVTLELSAGDLDAYIAPESFTRAGWNVGPASDYQPPITRAAAYDAVPNKLPKGGAPGNYGIYLRTLDGRLVWLVVLRQGQVHVLRVTAVDAATGAVLRDHNFPLLEGPAILPAR